MDSKLKEANVIVGIGMKSHLDDGYPSVQAYSIFIEKFIAAGLEVQILSMI